MPPILGPDAAATSTPITHIQLQSDNSTACNQMDHAQKANQGYNQPVPSSGGQETQQNFIETGSKPMSMPGLAGYVPQSWHDRVGCKRPCLSHQRWHCLAGQSSATSGRTSRLYLTQVWRLQAGTLRTFTTSQKPKMCRHKATILTPSHLQGEIFTPVRNSIIATKLSSQHSLIPL